MKEEFLHYVWSTKLFEKRNLLTTSGIPVEVLFSGTYNRDSGPDFSEARIRIGQELWVGNVEVHLRSSDFFRHRHQHDKAYGRLILHVVLEADVPGPEGVPCLELRHRIPRAVLVRYEMLAASPALIPCAGLLREAETARLQGMLDRCGTERLEQKTAPVFQLLTLNHFHWEEAFYQWLSRGFGARVNAEPFGLLARHLPLPLLARHKNNLLQLEALLFGTAGMLNDLFGEEYPLLLQKEFYFLQAKYQLQPLPAHIWKRFRLRPANFPAVRIAQFANLVHRSAHLFSRVLEINDLHQLRQWFRCQASAYWDTHYMFEKTSAAQEKAAGNHLLDLLLINTVVPMLFAYGIQQEDQSCKDKALSWLQQLGPEDNAVTRIWQQLGFPPRDAASSQAQLQLYREYCRHKRCLECQVGAGWLQESAR